MKRRHPHARRYVPLCLVTAVLAIIFVALPAWADQPVVLERVSVDTNDGDPNGSSQIGAVTPDGRYVAFESGASNLVASDVNGRTDIFLRDTCRGASDCAPSTILVSLADDGSQGNNNIGGGGVAISANGRYVAFASFASNLVANDNNFVSDIFIRDTCINAPGPCTPSTIRVSVASDGTEANSSSIEPNISEDGRYVAFRSSASNLVAGDTNGNEDVFLRDTCIGTFECLPFTTRVSVTSDGTEGAQGSLQPGISADGRFVVFRSNSTLAAEDTNGDFADIYLRDTCIGALSCTPSTTLLSVDSNNVQGTCSSVFPSISATGRVVAFSTQCRLDPSDTDNLFDMYVRDTCFGTAAACTPRTARVSSNTNGGNANNQSATDPPSISADGRFVAFHSLATTLDANFSSGQHVYVRDTCVGVPAGACTPKTVGVSRNFLGVPGDGISRRPAIGAGGRYVVLESVARNLVGDDTDNASDIFLAGSGLGPQSWFRAEGDATDFAGPNDAFGVNTPGFAAGVEGQAFSVNTSWFEAPDEDLPLGSAARSLEFWMNSSTAVDSIPVLYGDYNTANDAFYVAIVGGKACIGGGSVCGSASVLNGAWHHVRLAYNGVDTANLYVDGVLDATENRSYVTSAAGTLWLGAVNPLEQYYVGLLDEVKIFAGDPSQTPDLAVTKTASADPVLVDQTFTYTITVTNQGAGTATSVGMADPLPAEVSFVSVDDSSCFFESIVFCDIGTLAAGENRSFIITVTASSAGSPFNTATAAGIEEEANLGNNVASVGTTIAGEADVSITKTASTSPVIAGQEFSYTLTATNNSSTNTAELVEVADTLPAGLSLVSISPSGVCSGNPAIVCQLGTLAPLQSASVVITVRPGATGGNPVQIDNTATVTAFGPDPNSANNSDSARVQVRPGADLNLSNGKTDSPDPVAEGKQLTYTITVVNNGPDNATGVTVTDPLPASVTFDSADVTCTGTTTLSCDLGAISAGSSKAAHLVVIPSGKGVISNTASVAGQQDDPNPGNNSDGESTTVVGDVDPTVALSAAPSPVTAGNDLTYTVTLTNKGPSVADQPSVDLSGVLASAAFRASASSPGCVATSGVVKCTTTNLAANTSVNFTAVVTPVLVGTINATAEVSSDPDIDNNNNNNTAALSTQVNGATLPVGNPDSKGTEFWVAFMENLGNDHITLFVTGDQATAGLVEIPGLSFTQTFSVTPGQISTIELPLSTPVSGSGTVQDRAVHIFALKEVTVYGLNQRTATTDAFLALPTDILGTNYLVLGYQQGAGGPSEMAVAAAADNTSVTVTLPGGSPQNFTLNQGQAVQLQTTDVTGAQVTSDKPVAVFGGARCTNIPPGAFACDHVVEQIPPTSSWGRSFSTMPLATRLNGDTFRFLASVDNTSVSVNGTVAATLNRGEFHEQIINGPAQITASQPILVAQYSNGSTFDNVVSDPFMMLIPPFEQFLISYTVSTPATGFATNFVNVVAPSAAVGAINLDGAAIPDTDFTPIGTSGFSGVQVPVGLGSHQLTGPLPFGVFSYGFASFDSYGYPGGASLSAVATVASLSLSPTTVQATAGVQQCITATVLDSDNAPVAGVRVDFTVSGVNSQQASIFTDGQGHAQLCYTSLGNGTDTVTASVGSLTAQATITWSGGGDLADLSVDLSGSSSSGTGLGYVFQVGNNGPLAASNVRFTDTLSSNFQIVSIETSQGSCTVNGSTITCNLGALAADTNVTVTVTLNPPQAGWASQTVNVASDQLDPVQTNNIRTITLEQNRAPVANAGSTQMLSATSLNGAKVTLDGRSSSDPDGDQLSYRWSGPFPEGGGQVSGATATITLGFGTSTVKLTVSDGKVESSSEVKVTVTDFGMSLLPAEGRSITAGQTAEYTLRLEGVHGTFDRDVSLSCSNLPRFASCRFSQASVNVASGAVEVTVSISTAGQSAQAVGGESLFAWFSLGGLPVLGIFFLGGSEKRRAWLLLLLLAVVLGQVACGGGPGMTVETPAQAGTPDGNFSISVSGAAGSLQHSTVANLTVR